MGMSWGKGWSDCMADFQYRDDANDDYWVCGRTEREAQEKAEKKFPDKKVTFKRDEDVCFSLFINADVHQRRQRSWPLLR